MADANFEDFFSAGGGSGGFGQPNMPPAKKAPSGDLNAANFPMFTLSNGNTLLLTPTDSDSTTSPVQLVDDTGSVFSVSLTNINSALTLTLTYWPSLYWYDNVDNLFYVLAVDDVTANTVYLITITELGVIALVGSDTIANYSDGFALRKTGYQNYWRRAAQGSGDFTIVTQDGRETVISSADGTVSSTTVNISLTGGAGGIPLDPSYISRDGRVAIGGGITGTLNNATIHGLTFARKDAVGAVSMEKCMPNMIADSNGWARVKFIEWDGAIILTQAPTTANETGKNIYGPKSWDVVEFDEWLHSMCDFLGLAEKT